MFKMAIAIVVVNVQGLQGSVFTPSIVDVINHTPSHLHTLHTIPHTHTHTHLLCDSGTYDIITESSYEERQL